MVNGWITLKGKVTYDYERRAAEQAVLDAHNVSVEVSGDQVVLRGTVHSWIERHEAEKAAWAAPGVRSVKNYITVNAVA